MEFNNSIPIYVQVINKFKSDIITGRIQMGEKLPSTRDLAKELGINPNTATRIYRDLESMGICYKKRGLGTFITESEEVIKKIKKERGRQLINDFYNSMSKLNYTVDDMIDLLREKEQEKQGEDK